MLEHGGLCRFVAGQIVCREDLAEQISEFLSAGVVVGVEQLHAELLKSDHQLAAVLMQLSEDGQVIHAIGDASGEIFA